MQSGLAMQDKPSGGPSVIALPPFILGADNRARLDLEFFLARENFDPQRGRTTWTSRCSGRHCSRSLWLFGRCVRRTRPLDVRKAPIRIVTSGIFLRSRNPIYLGMVLLCAGIALVADSLWLAAMVPLLAVVLQKGVIEPEEVLSREKLRRGIFALQKPGPALDLKL